MDFMEPAALKLNPERLMAKTPPNWQDRQRHLRRSSVTRAPAHKREQHGLLSLCVAERESMEGEGL